MLRLGRVAEGLPPGFGTLQAESRGEGYDHIDRLANEWLAGTQLFQEPGCILLACFEDEELLGVGGLTDDFGPLAGRALRMRRFYVRPASRRRGIGRTIASALLDHARDYVKRVTLYTESEQAVSFWESIGFAADRRDGRTHIFEFGDRANAAISGAPS